MEAFSICHQLQLSLMPNSILVIPVMTFQALTTKQRKTRMELWINHKRWENHHSWQKSNRSQWICISLLDSILFWCIDSSCWWSFSYWTWTLHCKSKSTRMNHSQAICSSFQASMRFSKILILANWDTVILNYRTLFLLLQTRNRYTIQFISNLKKTLKQLTILKGF